MFKKVKYKITIKCNDCYNKVIKTKVHYCKNCEKPLCKYHYKISLVNGLKDYKLKKYSICNFCHWFNKPNK